MSSRCSSISSARSRAPAHAGRRGRSQCWCHGDMHWSSLSREGAALWRGTWTDQVMARVSCCRFTSRDCCRVYKPHRWMHRSRLNYPFQCVQPRWNSWHYMQRAAQRICCRYGWLHFNFWCYYLARLKNFFAHSKNWNLPVLIKKTLIIVI